MLQHLSKGYTLLLVSLIETGTPFIRMLLLTHALSLTELGFVSALTATISAFEQMTDFALYRYVFSAAREEYEHALAAAHGLAILRGLTVGGLVALAAPLIAGHSLWTHYQDAPWIRDARVRADVVTIANKPATPPATTQGTST